MVTVPNDLQQRLPLVRRGYDPYEVQRVVGDLTNEIAALQRANAELRRRLTEASSSESPPPVVADVVPHPDEVLHDARLLAQRMLEQAAFEAETLRTAARHEADHIMSEANQHRADVQQQHHRIGEQLRAAHLQISTLLDQLGRAVS